MDVRDALRAIRKLWLVVVALAVVGALVGLAVSLVLPPRYVSHSRLYFAFNSPPDATAPELVQANNFAIQKVSSYAQVGTSPRVLGRVVDELGMDLTAEELAREVSVSAEPESVVLSITASDDNPDDAATLARTVTDNLVEVVVDELESPAGGGTGPLRAEILQEAIAPSTPTRPGLPVAAGLGLFAGLVVGMVVAVLMAWRDRRVHGRHDVERSSTVPVLGSVVALSGTAPGLAVVSRPDSAEAAGYRAVAAAVLVDRTIGTARATAVFSSTRREDAAEVACNVAAALAESGLSVLLVDADLQRREVSALLGAADRPGLVEGLLSGAQVAPVTTSARGLSLVPAGVATPSTAAPFATHAFKAFLEEAAGGADIVLVASPPVLSSSDALLLADACRSSILVARAGSVSQDDLQSAISTLTFLGAPPNGLVLTNVPSRGPDSDARTRALSEAR